MASIPSLSRVFSASCSASFRCCSISGRACCSACLRCVSMLDGACVCVGPLGSDACVWVDPLGAPEFLLASLLREHDDDTRQSTSKAVIRAKCFTACFILAILLFVAPLARVPSCRARGHRG